MNFEEYQRACEDLEALEEHATEIAKRYSEDHRADFTRFERDEVVYEVFYSGCGTEFFRFPAEWLFINNWEEVVDAAIIARREAAERKKEADRLKFEREREESDRRIYEHLKAKFESR